MNNFTYSVRVAFLCILLAAGAPSAFSQQIEKHIKVADDNIGFLEYKPVGYATEGNVKHPLIIFLHGIGERGNGTTELKYVARIGLPAAIKKGNTMRYTWNGKTETFLVLSPQCPSKYGMWPQRIIDSLINYAKANLRIDPDRIYLTGLSMGGGGTLRYISTSKYYPKNIAAAATVCAPCTFDNGQFVADAKLPVWASHAADDAVALSSCTDRAINRINATNPEVKPLRTIWPTGGHGVWDRMYADPNYQWNDVVNVYEWFLGQNRTFAPNKLPVANAGKDFKVHPSMPFVTLNGSASTDADGKLVRYVWKKISGPAAGVINVKMGASPTTMVTGMSAVGVYRFELAVVDDRAGFTRDTVTVTVATDAPLPGQDTVKPAPAPVPVPKPDTVKPAPAAPAPAPKPDAVKPAPVPATPAAPKPTVPATPAPKPDTVKPAPAPVPVPKPDTVKPAPAPKPDTVKPAPAPVPVPKPDTVKPAPAPKPDTVKPAPAPVPVPKPDTVKPAPAPTPKPVPGPVVNLAPIAAVTPDQIIPTEWNYSPSVSGYPSKDPDGWIVRFRWSKYAGPDSFQIASPDSCRTKLHKLVPGIYIFRCTAFDNKGLSSYADVKITMTKNGVVPESNGTNKPPVTQVTPDQEIPLEWNYSPSVSGYPSKDSDGWIAKFEWTKVSGPESFEIASPNSCRTKLNKLVEGVYVFRCTSYDNKGAFSHADVKITMTKQPAKKATATSSSAVLETEAVAAIPVPVTKITMPPQIRVSPNPASGMVNLQYTSDATGQSVISVYDVSGKLLKNIPFYKNQSFYQHNLDISELRSGVYYVQVRTGTSVQMQTKIIKK